MHFLLKAKFKNIHKLDSDAGTLQYNYSNANAKTHKKCS